MLRPVQEQRWDPVEGFRPALASTSAQKELRTWSLIAVGALALAGVFAFLLVLGRVMHADDIYPWLVTYFDKFLIVHVNFSFIVWFVVTGIMFMQVAALRLSDGVPLAGSLGRMALAGGLLGVAMIAGSAMTDGAPSKNNYVPAILHPVFYLGLLAFAFAAATAATRTLANGFVRKGPLEPVGAIGIASSVITLTAIAAFAVSWNRAGGMPAIAADNEDIFWAGGHILQFLNVAVMIGAWAILGGRALGRPAISPRITMSAAALLAVLALVGFGLLFAAAPLSADERYLFTQYQYALAPAPIAVGLLLTASLLGGTRAEGGSAQLARWTVLVSLGVFFTGGILGIFVDGGDTRTPAHYHGVIGGVNVALMGLFYLFVLPLLERGLVRRRGALASIILYGAGQFLHSIGLFITGGYGAPRKVAGALDLDTLGNWIGHAGIGIGGAIAVLGGILFIWIAARRLLARAA